MRDLRNIITILAMLLLGGRVSAQVLALSEEQHQASADLLASQQPLHYILPSYELPILNPIDSYDYETAGNLLDYAHNFTGTRYRIGGKTPAGFDCSGFTGYVFRRFGYALGASSRDQYRNGVSIDLEETKPGDLIFFSGRARSKTTVGHVGIVVDNDPVTGRVSFIHSSCTGGVRVDHTFDPYYSSRLIGARRILTSEE